MAKKKSRSPAERRLEELQKYLALIGSSWGFYLHKRALAVLQFAERTAESYKLYPTEELFLFALLRASHHFATAVNQHGGDATVAARITRRRMLEDPVEAYQSVQSYTNEKSPRHTLISHAISAASAVNRKEITDGDIGAALLAWHDEEFPALTNGDWADRRLHPPYNTLAHIPAQYHPSLDVRFSDLYPALLEHRGSHRRLRIFLCHASDDRAYVRRVYGRLASIGYEPWMDVESLLPGQNWELEIRNEIRRTDVVLVFMSDAAVNKRGFVQKEIAIVLDLADHQPEGSIFVIPVRLSDCRVPDRLTRWQRVDLFRRGGFAQLSKVLAIASSSP